MHGKQVYDTEGGSNPASAFAFEKKLWALTKEQENSNTPGFEVDIVLAGKYVLRAYDHAALVQGIAEAVKHYAEEIS